MRKHQLLDAPKDLQILVAPYSHVFGSLSSSMTIESYDAKEQIIFYSKVINRLRFLVDGKAKITLVHENGNQSIVHFLHPGEFLGELTFLDIEKEHKNVEAISACTFITIDMQEAKILLKEDAKFLYTLSQYIGDKMLRRTHFNAKNQNYELRNRLAAYILTSSYQGIYTQKHTETADYLAVSYRHLLHTFKAFLDEGILTKHKRSYKIDEEALKELAKDIMIT